MSTSDPSPSARARIRQNLKLTEDDEQPTAEPRLDTPLVFPAAQGGPIQLDRSGAAACVNAAIEASGVPRPARIYDLRSTFASGSLAVGVSVFHLARLMGTSLKMIEKRYGTLIDGATEDVLARLDSLDAANDEATETSGP